MESNLNKELILKSTRKLIEYEEHSKPINLSPQLNLEGSECLKRRRELIDEGTDRKLVSIRNFVVEVQVKNEWLTVDKIQSAPRHVKQQDVSSHPETEEPRPSTLNNQSFNARSQLDIHRKTFFAYAIAQTNFVILCFAESWLTTEVPNSAVFLQDYHVYRNARQATETQKTRQGGVIIAVRNDVKHESILVV